MNVIYRPRGRALEYSYLACNLYGGMCPHRCSYCYVAGAMRKSRAQWEATPWYVRKDVIKWLAGRRVSERGEDVAGILATNQHPAATDQRSEPTSKKMRLMFWEKFYKTLTGPDAEKLKEVAGWMKII